MDNSKSTGEPQGLDSSKAFLESAINSIQDGVCIINPEHVILQVNATMERWYAHAMTLVGKK